jgi:hypothetical protein
MGKKVKIANRKKPGTVKAPRAAARPKKPLKRRAHSITLADLFLWMTVADECFVHPVKAFARAAAIEGIAVGNVTHGVERLEKHFGELFKKGDRPRASRNGVLSNRGAALAELFVMIELLYRMALGPVAAVSVMKLKDALMPHFPEDSWRRHDRLGTARVFRAMRWQQRLKAEPKKGKVKKLHEWPLNSSYGRLPSPRSARSRK